MRNERLEHYVSISYRVAHHRFAGCNRILDLLARRVAENNLPGIWSAEELAAYLTSQNCRPEIVGASRVIWSRFERYQHTRDHSRYDDDARVPIRGGADR
jgi:hypothetical protein